MYVIIYRYDVDPAQRERFEQEYGQAGGWVSMFARADGYVGSRLYRDVDETVAGYLVLDQWDGLSAFQEFMRQRGDDYHARSATTRDLYRDEWQIAALEVPADPLTRRPSAHPGQRLSGGPS
jgi:heme-degrading monooxygenase HmoA